MNILRLLAPSFLAVTGLVAVACDVTADCSSICNRYQSCFDEDYDAEECIDRCTADAESEEYRARANECDACINERDCVETAFNCSECSDIVP